MRIRRISAEGLFGLFDHSIPLNQDEHITIIHGANGLGKTALLRLLNGFFNSKYSELLEIPFSVFQIEFEDGSHIRVRKSLEKAEVEEKNRSKTEPSVLSFDYLSQTGSHEKYRRSPNRVDAPRLQLEELAHYLELETSGLERSRENIWLYRPTGETFTLDEVLTRFGEHLPSRYRATSRDPEWLINLKGLIDVHFIQSQRLVTFQNQRRSSSFRADYPAATQAVQVYSEEITRAIKNTLAEYAELSQSLDRTFPERLVRQNREQNNLASDE